MLENNDFNLSQMTIENLGYYIYLLVDPRNDNIFYVGKGKGKRIYEHVLGIDKDQKNETEKEKVIQEIKKQSLQVKHLILRHGLTEKEAFEVESVVIDLIDKGNLTNLVRGYQSEERGIMTLDEIKIKYEEEEAIITEPMILISINNDYISGMTPEELYEMTRQHWKVDTRRANKVSLAVCVC